MAGRIALCSRMALPGTRFGSAPALSKPSSEEKSDTDVMPSPQRESTRR
jgi:hypothetical protein